MIGIVAYGSGNIAAIENVLTVLGEPHMRLSSERDFAAADRLILPGVGAFDTVMARLRESGLLEPLEAAVLDQGKPVLGICVGMQILGNSSDEGQEPGLGWIPGEVRRIDTARLNSKPHLPHMGWNTVESVRETPLFANIDPDRGFYFLHSFCFHCQKADNEIARTHYGSEFTVAVQRENVMGVQFHPEKSHKNGVTLLANFAGL